MTANRYRRGIEIGLSFLSIGLLVLAWQALVYLHVYRFAYIPSLPQVIVAGSDYVFSSDFLSDAIASALRVLAAWSIAAIIAIPLGLAIGWNRTFSDLTLPTLELLRPIPPIAWIPAGILFFPNVEGSVVFICFVGAFFPILLNTVNGVKQIEQTHFRAARCLGAGQPEVFRDVVVRGAMPSIIVGLALGMGIAWMALVAAEMIAGQYGLGYMIWRAYSLAQYPLIIVGMIAIGLIGAGMSVCIRLFGRKLTPWQSR
jgi:NitT/TauT family transport system permease protein